MAQDSDIIQVAAGLARRAADLLESGDLDEAAEAQRQAEHAMRRAIRVADKSRGATTRTATRSASQSDRDVVVAALSELGAPSSPKLLSTYAAARFGAQVRPSSLASVRRDERRAWRSPRSERPVYLAPALEASRFTPLRGFLTLTDWDLDRRIMGPRSARVDYLRATREVARHYKWLTETGADPKAVDRMAHLVGDLARTLPDVGDAEGRPVAEDVERAVTAELSLLEPDDLAYRGAAADRARKQLDGEQQTWGAAPLGVVGAGGTG